MSLKMSRFLSLKLYWVLLFVLWKSGLGFEGIGVATFTNFNFGTSSITIFLYLAVVG